jgi:hypothetical protein
MSKKTLNCHFTHFEQPCRVVSGLSGAAEKKGATQFTLNEAPRSALLRMRPSRPRWGARSVLINFPPRSMEGSRPKTSTMFPMWEKCVKYNIGGARQAAQCGPSLVLFCLRRAVTRFHGTKSGFDGVSPYREGCLGQRLGTFCSFDPKSRQVHGLIDDYDPHRRGCTSLLI